MLNHQITVPIDDTAREYLERRARLEDRPMASVVRRCIADAKAREDRKRRVNHPEDATA